MRQEKIKLEGYTVQNLTFDSLQDFSESITKSFGDNFSNKNFLGATLPVAKELLANGWPEGRAKLEQFRGKLENITSRSIVKQELIYDVTGLDFDMGLVMEGQPECWYDFSPREEQRIVRMLYSVTASASVTKEQLMLRGAGMVALIDLLEQHNVRVELDICFSANFCKVNYHGKIPVKAAGDPLDIDRIAFVMMNDAMSRQLVFSLYETISGGHDNTIPHCSVEHSAKDYDMSIGVAFGSDDAFKNIQSTLEWIKSKLAELGVKLEGE